jgi:hypothetical protein
MRDLKTIAFVSKDNALVLGRACIDHEALVKTTWPDVLFSLSALFSYGYLLLLALDSEAVRRTAEELGLELKILTQDILQGAHMLQGLNIDAMLSSEGTGIYQDLIELEKNMKVQLEYTFGNRVVDAEVQRCLSLLNGSSV